MAGLTRPAIYVFALVMAGYSRPNDGVLPHAYVPAIHVFALVMAGLVPAIHVFSAARPQDVDARHMRKHAVLSDGCGRA